MRIKDDEGGFYFKNPRQLIFASDGHFFCLDENQFLESERSGRFLRNFLRAGQGPGELRRIEAYFVKEKEVVAHQTSPHKIVIFDREGNLLLEFKPEVATNRLLGQFKEKCLMAQSAFPQVEKMKKDEEVLEVDWNFCFVSRNGEVEKIEGLYSTHWFFKKFPSALIADYITEIIGAVFDDNSFVFTPTQEYRLKNIELEKRRLIRVIERKYPPVRFKPGKKAEESPGLHRLDVPRTFYNEVQKIFVGNKRMCFFTSTIDRKRGFRVDLFDQKGSSIDNFYLPLQEKIPLSELGRYSLWMDDSSVALIKTDETGDIFLVKGKRLG